MTDNPVHIIGVTPKGASWLSPEALKRIHEADTLIGGERLLKMFPDSRAEKLVIARNLPSLAAMIREKAGGRRIVVLASGDPGFFGIAGYLIRNTGKERLVILPSVSSLQTAFARIGEPWDDAVLLSAHGRDAEALLPRIAAGEKIAILTDDRHTPSAIAGMLRAHGMDAFSAWVCEDLDSEEENFPLSPSSFFSKKHGRRSLLFP
jgi:precorrin-6Y C5,15-methyltransferase (decarboxylating)